MHESVEYGARHDVPETSFAGDVPLVAVMRGNFVGSLHRGSFVAVESNGHRVASAGNAHERVFLRSAAKPFQVLPAVLSGAVDSYGVSQRELAVLCASHSGEPRHVEAVRSVLAKIGEDESALQCGIHPPIHESTMQTLLEAGRPFTPACNNCSGAHSGMLLACKMRGWPLDSYRARDHPLQILTREILASFAGVTPNAVEIATDNCAVPTFRLSLLESALAFARLASGSGVDPDLSRASRRVVDAMTAFPDMVGGLDRFDTDLMIATEAHIVSKGGAEGFQGVGLIDERIGIALKISDGAARAIPPTMMRLLEHLRPFRAAELNALKGYAEPDLQNLLDEHVGRLVPIFESDNEL